MNTLLRHAAIIVLPMGFVASCSAPPPSPAPAPPPAPAPAPAPAPTAAPKPLPDDWRDWEVKGDWFYREDERGAIALFGPANSEASFVVRCDKGERTIFLSRQGKVAGPVTMTIATSAETFALPAAPTGGAQPYVAAKVDPWSKLLDNMIFSRGKVAVTVAGLQSIAISSRPEIARTVEFCRK